MKLLIDKNNAYQIESIKKLRSLGAFFYFRSVTALAAAGFKVAASQMAAGWERRGKQSLYRQN
jgi:hypothetical protein